MPYIDIHGVDCHIGSQLTEIEPFLAAMDRVLLLVDKLEAAGINITHLDLGGGVGIRYRDETPPDIARYAQALLARLTGRKFKLLLEPGRALVGNAGILLTRVEYIKTGESKNFAIVDAAMNDLMRPALYDAWHDIVPVEPRIGATENFEIVGPVCESGDFLGHDRALCIEQGDLLAVMSAGAYGMSMSSNYNSRPRAAEVMVNGSQMQLVRERETIAGLFAQEIVK
jgi:diaminopimelate decarboxylase